MMNGRLFLTAAALLLAAGCAKQDLGSAYRSDPDAVRILAQVGGDEVSGGFVTTRSVPVGEKAEAEEAFKSGDRIFVTASSQKAVVYTLDGTNWTPEDGKFLKWVNSTMDFSAYYPVAEGVDMQNFAVPSDQSDEEKIASADYMTCSEASVERAKEHNGVSLTFQRKMARIVVEPSLMNQFPDGTSISSISVCGNTTGYSGGSVAAGNVEVKTYALDGKYYALLSPSTQDGESVFLKVTLSNGTLLQAKGIPETAAGNSYTVSLKVGKDVASVSSVSVTDWTDGSITGGLAVLVPYVTFSAASEQMFSMTFNGSFTLGSEEYFEYSVGGGKWTRFTKTVENVAFGGDKGNLRLRGKSSNGTASSTSKYSTISFSEANVDVKCTGDIRTLIDYTAYSKVETVNARFCKLFQNCTALTSAPELPATTLASSCYYSMFESCTALTSAPALPATTLASNCYRNMFYGCTSLTSAPALPAEILASSCYYSMFQCCDKLTSAPALPATKMAEYCYSSMFSYCTSLETAPVLPATELANSCYSYMFQNCTSLTTVPKLLATELAYDCYHSMFQGCTKLETAPELLATTLAEYCYSAMFSGCTKLTSAPELKVTTLAKYCYSSMFSRCTSLTSAPVLPATTLAEYCYSNMFYNCTSLETAPALPAPTLASNCYSYMFQGCTALTSAPELPATTLADYCYNEMFYGCTSLTTAPALNATELKFDCYHSMFYGCTSLTTVPQELPATDLKRSCYQAMFYGCTSLTSAPALNATTLVNNCYRSMFSGCTSLSSVTMLATDVNATDCLYSWLNNAGTKASSRTLTLASEVAYTAIVSKLPANWQQGATATTVIYPGSSSSTGE